MKQKGKVGTKGAVWCESPSGLPKSGAWNPVGDMQFFWLFSRPQRSALFHFLGMMKSARSLVGISRLCPRSSRPNSNRQFPVCRFSFGFPIRHFLNSLLLLILRQLIVRGASGKRILAAHCSRRKMAFSSSRIFHWLASTVSLNEIENLYLSVR
jgi:hypothetical protein